MLQPGAGAGPFDAQRQLTTHQKTLLALIGIGSMLEFWDAYLIGFIMAFLVKPWGLTYGVLGMVLLASGAGAIIGGVVWGVLADRIGRKPVFVSSLLLLAAASLGLAFTPERGWVYMVVLRVVIGFCTGAYFVQVALVQEFVPPSRRGLFTGIVSAITTGGLLLGAFCGAYVIPTLGWRWTFALGAAPALIALVGAFYIPESPRWLLLRGRGEESRRSVAWALQRPVSEVASIGDMPAVASANWLEIFRWPRSAWTAMLINVGLLSGYFGIVLWAPTLLAQILAVSPADASRIMIGFSVLGIAARVAAAVLADRIGRRRAGGYFALAACVAIVVAGYVGHGNLGTPSLFWLPLLVAFVFADGSFSVCALYSTEIWPSRLRGCGSGFAGLSGSVGKIVGPLGLALVAGSSSLVMPQATAAVIVPAFLFLGLCLAVCGVTYLWGAVEARGLSLEAMDEVMG